VIRIIKDKRVEWFIRFILPSDNLLALDPIIAGGSMLSLYRAIKLHDTPEKWETLKRSLELRPSTSKLDAFSDIDIWFNKTNPIHNTDHKFNWLINSLPESKAVGITKNDLGLFKIYKTSKWANSYYPNSTTKNKPLTREVQFIKKSFSSIEELLETFDFVNCSVAWHDGKLYYDDRIDDAFGSFELRLNSSAAYESSSIAMKVFSALRAFKYSSRYSLDFCPTLTNHIFKLYYNSKTIDYDAYLNHVVELEEHYGKTISSVNTLKEMVQTFHGNFKRFSIMKHFKKDYSLYLIDYGDNLPGLKELVGGEEADLEAKCFTKSKVNPLNKFKSFKAHSV